MKNKASLPYSQLIISEKQAENWAASHFNKVGQAQALAGELDFNFKISCTDGSIFILKISRPDADSAYLDFQQKLLTYISEQKPDVLYPKQVLNTEGQTSTVLIDEFGQSRSVRMLEWVSGRLWSTVNPQSDDLRYSLGENCGAITRVLQHFDHPKAHRSFDWDITEGGWTTEYLHLFDSDERSVIQYFQKQFTDIQPLFSKLRKSVIHNDANDNNIIVSSDLRHPSVISLIDYGDAVYSQTINDLAVALAYALMNQPDPLATALPLVAGYHKNYPLQADELSVLYILTAMRLVISVSKSAINKQKEPNNTYLQISEKPAWAVLKKWQKIPPQYAHYTFRHACGLTPLPHFEVFESWAKLQNFSIKTVFPTLPFTSILPLDLSIGSTFLGNFSEYKNDAIFTTKMIQHQLENPNALLAGGYCEARPIYSTKAYEKEGNNGFEYRTIHLGLDIWASDRTPVHAFMDGDVYGFGNNKGDKDYGPTIILKHTINAHVHFYSLYGHLSEDSLEGMEIGKTIKSGEKIGYLGHNRENGNWPPHLHFQLMLDTLGNKSDFAGVAFPSELAVWASICPDPNLLFKDMNLANAQKYSDSELIAYRKAHLGKSLSLSYSIPLKIVRGEMQYLIDTSGRRYLDTVNNVPHVGHEHPRIVKAGQRQMAVLNTNTRYLHDTILDFAKELLSTMPPELSVVHFVNSGSEANELALRMAQAVTNQKDMIALEIGYHGNTNGCMPLVLTNLMAKAVKANLRTHILFHYPTAFGAYTKGIFQKQAKNTLNMFKNKLSIYNQQGAMSRVSLLKAS